LTLDLSLPVKYSCAMVGMRSRTTW
jgi:hypothetical protein